MTARKPFQHGPFVRGTGHEPSPHRLSLARWAWRLATRASAVAGIVLTFALGLIGGLLVHLSVRAARSLATREMNAVLASSFKGRIVCERIAALGLTGIAGADVTVEDPRGVPVLVVRGARAHWPVVSLVRSALWDTKAPLFVHIASVEVDRGEVDLDSDADGRLLIAEALGPAGPPEPPSPHARGLRLQIDRIVLGRAWVHGTMAGAPPIDADVDDLEGALISAPDRLEGDVRRLGLFARRMAEGADLRGVLRGHVLIPSLPDGPRAVRADWSGVLGRSEHAIHAELRDGRIDAALDAPAIDPTDVRRLLPAAAPDERGAFHAEAHGALSHVALASHASLGHGALDMSGTAAFGQEKSADIGFDLVNIDAQRFASSAPATRFDASGHVDAVVKMDGGLMGKFEMRVGGGRIGDYDTPPFKVECTGTRRPNGDVHARAALTIEEPSAPTGIAVQVEPRGPRDLGVDFAVHSDVAELADVPVLRHRASGRLHVAGRGTIDLGSMDVDGNVEARAERLLFGPTRVEFLSLEAAVRGAAGDPDFDVTARSRGITAAGKRLTRASLFARGRASSARVDAQIRGPDLPDTDLSTQLSLRPSLSIDGLRAHLTRAGENASLLASRVTVGGGMTRIDGMQVEGVGDPLTASLAMTAGKVRLKAMTNGIDLGRVGRLAALERDLRAGTLAVDTEIDLDRSGARGYARADLSDAAIRSAPPITAHLDVTCAGRSLSGKVHAEGGTLGSIDASAHDLQLGGSGPVLETSWRELWGSAQIEGHADVGRVAALIPADDRPFDEAQGRVAFKMGLNRKSRRDLTPDVALNVATADLLFAPKTAMHRDIDGVLVVTPPPWRLAGIDLDLDGRLDGDSGRVELTTRLRDKRGLLVQGELGIERFPSDDLYADSARFRHALLATPVDLDVRTPMRDLGTMPDLFKQDYVSGKVQAGVSLRGTVLAPVVDVALALKDSQFSHTSRSQVLELSAESHYDGEHGTLHLVGSENGRQALDVEAQVRARTAAMFESDGESSSMPWTASMRARFSGFPLGAVPMLDERLVSGSVNGEVTVESLHQNARAKVSLALDQLKVGSFAYKAASIDADADAGELSGRVWIDQGDGSLQSDVKAASTWGAAIAPVIAPGSPLDMTLALRNFRIGVLVPFLQGTVDELDGRLDGTTHLVLEPTLRRANLSGQLKLSRGVVEAVAGGGELHDVSAEVHFAPDGTATLEKLTASGLSGRLEANGSARFDGTSLQSARAVIVIPAHSPIPVTAGGTEIGNVDGRIEVVGEADRAHAVDVKVDVPHLHVALPDSSRTSAIGLGTIDDLRVGAHRGRTDTFVTVPLDPTRPKQTDRSSTATHIETSLQDVLVTRGTDVAIGLRGRVDVLSGDKSKVTGQIQLKRGGHLSVQGKTFVVESGTVTFVGDDSSNPEIVLKAGWTAKDGTVVTATFLGPLKTGKVTLSSEPALPQEEIVQLLLFGTPDGSQAQNPSTSTTSSAIGTVGGQAAQPLNHLLNQWGLGAISVNVDTSESSAPKPEVAVQIARDISLQIAVVLGQPPPGVNPDTYLLTIDWRFLSRWSFASTVGNAGTTIFDLLWRKQY
ncbi:MAG: translocation/assembly module TamB domain-containing protein [Polyangiaceae bacterium]